MNEDQPPSLNGSTGRSWIERLGHALFAGEPRSLDQLRELIRDAHRRDLVDIDALGMIEGVFRVTDMRVRDIMIPRAQMVVIEQDAPLESMLKTMLETGHSRFPVIGENRDEVVGILLAKDVLRCCAEGEPDFRVEDYLRPGAFIPESKRLNVLLKEFRASRNHMAIVVDEYGGVGGLVTIEDVLEQIVGEIDDEHDLEEDEDEIYAQGNGTYIVKALTEVPALNAFFGTDFSDEESDTVGGLVMNALGYLPKIGDSVTIGDLEFEVLRADNRRLYSLQVNRAGARADSLATDQ